MNLNVDKRNDIIRINRLAKTAIDIFNNILNKKSLDKKGGNGVGLRLLLLIVIAKENLSHQLIVLMLLKYMTIMVLLEKLTK